MSLLLPGLSDSSQMLPANIISGWNYGRGWPWANNSLNLNRVKYVLFVQMCIALSYIMDDELNLDANSLKCLKVIRAEDNSIKALSNTIEGYYILYKVFIRTNKFEYSWTIKYQVLVVISILTKWHLTNSLDDSNCLNIIWSNYLMNDLLY